MSGTSIFSGFNNGSSPVGGGGHHSVYDESDDSSDDERNHQFRRKKKKRRIKKNKKNRKKNRKKTKKMKIKKNKKSKKSKKSKKKSVPHPSNESKPDQGAHQGKSGKITPHGSAHMKEQRIVMVLAASLSIMHVTPMTAGPLSSNTQRWEEMPWHSY
jgi:preprotein translocase subunit SecF